MFQVEESSSGTTLFRGNYNAAMQWLVSKAREYESVVWHEPFEDFLCALEIPSHIVYGIVKT